MAYRKATGTRIADAVHDLLQDGSALYWSQSGETDWTIPVSFVRSSVPEMQKENLLTAKCYVVFGAVEHGENDRAWEYLNYTVSVGVAKSVGVNAAGREDDVSDCLALVEQIQDFLCWDTQQTLTLPAVVDGDSNEIQPAHTARLILPFENNPAYDTQILRTEGVFLGITNFVYHFEKLRAE